MRIKRFFASLWASRRSFLSWNKNSSPLGGSYPRGAVHAPLATGDWGLATAFVLLLALPAHAVTIEKPLTNPAQERTAQGVIHQLKCVVCEGQSLADSDATFAKEMRSVVRDMAGEGATQAEILTYFRARYGDRILLTPPVERKTMPLWLGPVLLLLLGAALLWRNTRHAGTKGN